MDNIDSDIEPIHIRFVGARPNDTFTARWWAIPGHDGLFHALPPDVTGLVIHREKSLFKNGPYTREREPVELGEARCWGLNHERSVIFARASGSYCLRFIFNASYVLRNEHLEPYQAYERLVADAKFHSLYLDVLEGDIAPRHYGMWKMDKGDWAGDVLFSITDYCGMSWNDLKHSKLNTLVNRERIGRTLEMLHDAGVNHGQLDYDLRHVMLDIYDPTLSPSDDDLYTGKVPCYVTDFSAATFHKCPRKLPIVPLDAFPEKAENDCCEVLDILSQPKFVKLVNPDESSIVTRAIKWHDEYTEEYPDEPPLHVMMAQRAKLFKEAIQIYTNVLVEFVPGPRMDRAQITLINDDSDEDEEEELEGDQDDCTEGAVTADGVADELEQLTLGPKMSRRGRVHAESTTRR